MQGVSRLTGSGATMEEIILFLANSISNGAVGHYVSKGLAKIDSELPLLLQKETDLEEVRRIIESRNIEDEIIKFAEQVRTKIKNENASNVVNFTGGLNHGVVANKVELKNTKKQVKVEAPQGTVASSLPHRNYSKYLIDRYHEFKKAEVGKSAMNYRIFYDTINRKFGAKWDMVPLGRFGELTAYIQERIDRTILGKNNKSKNIKSYSSFEEYVAKHGG